MFKEKMITDRGTQDGTLTMTLDDRHTGDNLLILSVVSLSPLGEVFPPSQVFSLTQGSIHSCEEAKKSRPLQENPSGLNC